MHSITSTSFNGTTNFVATYNPITMKPEVVGDANIVNALTTFTYDESLKSYVVYIKNDSVLYNANGNYKVRLHYGVNQSSYSTYSFNIDTEQITGLTLYSAAMDENNLYYTTDVLDTQIVNDAFTLTFNKKTSGARISALYYKLTLNQTNDYNQLLNTVINTTNYSLRFYFSAFVYLKN